MKSIPLGTDAETNQPVRVPTSAFTTHMHLVGGTGKGKTTALHTMLHSLMMDPLSRDCFIIVDRLGNFSQELLLWMASPQFCTESVRRRLLYICPAREDRVLTFNPLLYDTPAHGYYKVERATEIILRAWESVNIEAMPRLARWTFNAFWAAAQLGLTIADCVHLLMPGSDYHRALLERLPPRLQAEWTEITSARHSEATRILDSSRNRLKPYFESDILRRMFGARTSRLDVARWMRDGRIVLVDLSPRGRLATQLANTIGALLVNEVLATARSLPLGERYPTYLVLDEFQNFVGPDLESALPEVRQLGIRLLLSHQSFAQLKRGDYDLSSMIWQAQSRFIFGVQGEDADLLAHEVATIRFDPDRIKEERYTRRQRVAGHEIRVLSSWSSAKSSSSEWNKTYGRDWSQNEGVSQGPHILDEVKSRSSGRSDKEGRSEGYSFSGTDSTGGHETLVPIHEDFMELASRSYVGFEEQRTLWAQKIRLLTRGQCLLRLVDEPAIRLVNVKRSAVGYLQLDAGTLARQMPQVIDQMNQLVENNFAAPEFVSAVEVDREAEHRLESLLRPTTTMNATSSREKTTAKSTEAVQESVGPESTTESPFT